MVRGVPLDDVNATVNEPVREPDLSVEDVVSQLEPQ